VADNVAFTTGFLLITVQYSFRLRLFVQYIFQTIDFALALTVSVHHFLRAPSRVGVSQLPFFLLMASRHQYSISAPGLLGASVTVLITTLEDCVWLIPFVAQAARVSPRIALIHAFIFVATFAACSVAACSIAIILSSAIVGSITNSDLVLEIAGAALCWIFSGYFFWQAYKKRRAKENAQIRHEVDDESLLEERPPEETLAGQSQAPYGATEAQNHVQDDEGGSDALQNHDIARPWVIVSLTILGSLDEISYFPALIVGEVFTSAELIMGTVIASLLILLLVESIQRYCHGCLAILDRIPLYAVIAVFAIILSVEAIVDALTD
jgi:hypothetical protein